MKAIFIDDDAVYGEYFKRQAGSWAKEYGLHMDLDITEDIRDVLCSRIKYDVYFIDINMPQISGLDLVRELRKSYVDAEFIFVSAYDEYMQEAFFVKPSAYVKKDRLENDLRKVFFHLKEMEDNRHQMVLLKNGQKMFEVNPFDIIYCKSVEHYVYLILRDGSTAMLRTKMDVIDEKLQSFDFVRIHRRYLVNLRFIEEVRQNMLVLTSGDVLEISRSRRDKLDIVLFNWFAKKAEVEKAKILEAVAASGKNTEEIISLINGVSEQG